MSKPEQHPGGYTLRPVLEGDTYARTVEGGVRRSPVPADGLLVVMEDREVFLAATELVAALQGLVIGQHVVDRITGRGKR